MRFGILVRSALASGLLVVGLGTLTSSPVQAQSGMNQQERETPQSDDDDDRASQIGQGRTFGPTEVSDEDVEREDRTGDDDRDLLSRSRRMLEPAEPSEFEEYVESVLGRSLPVFGADLVLPENRDFASPATATVPPDYRLNVGDVISISMTGAIEGSVRREIDTNGNIFLQNVGTIHLAGVRRGDLRETIARAIGTQFRNFRVGVQVEDLRGIRVFVTGFANNPGAFTVSSLSTMANAVLQAGGPSAGGSMRRIKLIRDGREVMEFDLYDFIRGGSRLNDAVLENEDVLLIMPTGPQVAIFGSVNTEAIFELKEGETIADVIDLAGGSSSLGDASRVLLYRAVPGDQPGPIEVARSEAAQTPALAADIVQVLPLGSLIQPTSRQSIIVRVEGEVQRPGNYYVAPGTSLGDVLALAGGTTDRAFPFGTRLYRESVRLQQLESFDYAIDQVELMLASAPLTNDASVQMADQQRDLAAAQATLDRLRETEPDGRLVLPIDPQLQQLPVDLLMENNDRLYIPVRPTSVGVFGAVYRPASFMIGTEPGRIRDYIDQAGGTIRAADRGDIFVVHASGEVVPRNRGALGNRALPGDVVFVPVETNSRDILAKIAQISSILFQFGLSAATVAAIN